jgi:hypothetical protein
MTLLDELDTTVATLSPPRVETEDDGIEEETAVVGEAAAAGGDAAASDE